MRFNIFIGFIILFSFTSCEKLLFKPDEAGKSPQENLDYLWQRCDERYSYFELKNVDWDSVKTVYNTKIYDGMSQDSLFKVLGSMLNELQDGHVNLISSFNISFYPFKQEGQDNFDWQIIEQHYLPDNYYISGPFQHDFIANNQIGYVRFKSFTGGVSESNIGFILARYSHTKGLILDLRENGGGAVSDVFEIISRFINEPTLTSYTRIKSGAGINDFGEVEPVWVNPNEGRRYNNPVMVLVDRGSYSASSFLALATKSLDNVKLVGDFTGGGLGLPNGETLPIGWTFRFSITQALNLSLDESWENGVPPDITQLFDWNDLTQDEIIERAIDEILNQ